MHAVSPNRDNPEDENSKFWDASPGGEFKLNCANAAATAEFELGEEYYFDIHKAPKS